VLARVVFILTVIPGLAQGAGLNEMYANDYEAFWRQWHEMRGAAVECSNPEKMAEFISSAVDTFGNAEVSEANAEAIEAAVISDAECVLKGLLVLHAEQRRKAIGIFLGKPLFSSSAEIESAIGRIWIGGRYAELREAYESASRDR
jgi:hypothetical protein